MVGYSSPLPGDRTGSWEGHGSVNCGGSSHPCDATQTGRLLHSLVRSISLAVLQLQLRPFRPLRESCRTRGRKKGAEGLPLLVCAVAIVSSLSLSTQHPPYRHRGIVVDFPPCCLSPARASVRPP